MDESMRYGRQAPSRVPRARTPNLLYAQTPFPAIENAGWRGGALSDRRGGAPPPPIPNAPHLRASERGGSERGPRRRRRAVSQRGLAASRTRPEAASTPSNNLRQRFFRFLP